MSLVGSIFGASDESKKAAGLTSLFDESLELPQKPQHKPLPPPRKKKRKEAPVTEEEAAEQPLDGKKKRKQRKSSAAKETESVAAAAAETTATLAEGYTAATTTSAEERTIFVGNLPIDTTRKSLANIFKPCGKVESCRLRSVAAAGVKLPTERAGDQNLVKKVCANTKKLDTTLKNTAQGYVVFVSQESVQEALKLNNTAIGNEGLLLRVDHATPTLDASRSVFVGNLPYQADETTLHKHFCKGCDCEETDVEGVRIIRDKETMQCKGFGYVLFCEPSMVAVALRKMHETKYMKRELRVTVCGKRYKGRRGEVKSNDSKRRSFEGKRSAAASQGAIKRILGKKPSKKDEKASASSKKRRARGETRKGAKSGAKSAGLSKRAAAEAKVGKRMKKIQKRVSKGMGKTRGR